MKHKPTSCPTDLTWGEKNPIDYCYRSSKAIERLKCWLKELDEEKQMKEKSGV